MKCEYDCFEILPKVEAMKYLEHVERKGNITHENGISEEVSIERETKMLTETHLLGENYRETTEKQHCGVNSLVVSQDGDSNSD